MSAGPIRPTGTGPGSGKPGPYVSADCHLGRHGQCHQGGQPPPPVDGLVVQRCACRCHSAAPQTTQRQAAAPAAQAAEQPETGR